MSDTTNQPTIYIIAGPNGAGKTTFAKAFLPKYANCREFLNADLIAAGLSPFNSNDVHFQASEIMLARMNSFIDQRRTFAFETTLSARSYLAKIPQWKALGYRVSLFFLWLPTVDFAIQRVNNRVRQGGHDIPPDIIRRRYKRGLLNFINSYAAVVDDWQFFEGSESPPSDIASCFNKTLTVASEYSWNRVQTIVQKLRAE